MLIPEFSKNFTTHIITKMFNNLRDFIILPLCWHFLLGLVSGHPTSIDFYFVVITCCIKGWVDQIIKHRAAYERKRKIFLLDPFNFVSDLDEKEIASDAKKLLVENPLSTDTESMWNKHLLNVNIQSQLDQELYRLFPEINLFQNEAIHNTLRTMLLV
jgi:hypothetical protein